MATATAAAGGGAATAGAMSLGARLSGILATITGLYEAVKNSTPEGLKDNVNGAPSFADSVTRFLFDDKTADQSFAKNPVDGNAVRSGDGWAKLVGWLSYIDQKLSAPGQSLQPGIAQQQAIDNSPFPGKTKDDFGVGLPKSVTIDAASISAMVQPVGVQQVHIVNPVIPNVTVSAPITITGVTDANAAASSAASQLGAQVKSAVEAVHSD